MAERRWQSSSEITKLEEHASGDISRAIAARGRAAASEFACRPVDDLRCAKGTLAVEDLIQAETKRKIYV